MRLRGVILMLTPFTLALGCENNPIELERDDGLARVALGSLEQTVAITPRQPIPGDRVWISSIVINRGGDPKQVESRICGLDLEADVDLQWTSAVACAGYSTQGDLPPGDSLLGGDRRIVGSPPGEYSLRVRHLLDPEVWVEVAVRVREP